MQIVSRSHTDQPRYHMHTLTHSLPMKKNKVQLANNRHPRICHTHSLRSLHNTIIVVGSISILPTLVCRCPCTMVCIIYLYNIYIFIYTLLVFIIATRDDLCIINHNTVYLSLVVLQRYTFDSPAGCTDLKYTYACMYNIYNIYSECVQSGEPESG